MPPMTPSDKKALARICLAGCIITALFIPGIQLLLAWMRKTLF